MPDLPPALDLAIFASGFNPFEPAASGPPIGIPFSMPAALERRLRDLVRRLARARGPKVIVVLGDYGAGKTCLLEWLHNELLPEHRIRPYYFDNPGVYFYALANTLLRTIGRKDFAKFIWELAGPHVDTPYQTSLFGTTFEDYLSATSRSGRKRRQDMAAPLQAAVIAAGVTADEQIAHCLARIVTDAVHKPYFEYRDFLPRGTDSLVAEAEEAPYFGAILKTLTRGSGATATAFLIDEFEEIGLQKRLTKRAAHDYLSTLKRLINLTLKDDNPFWLFLTMTPDAYRTTCDLEPGLQQRFAAEDGVLKIQPLDPDDITALIRSRLDAARPQVPASASRAHLFPFPSDLPFSPATRANPRRLVKVCSYAISVADGTTPVPFTTDYLRRVEARLFPTASRGIRDATDS